VQPTVSGLEQEFPGRVVAHNVDATTPDSKRQVENLGFSNHGLVIRSSAEGEALWSQPDHEVDIVAVRAKITELVEK
jgi:hypothetical protein